MCSPRRRRGVVGAAGGLILLATFIPKLGAQDGLRLTLAAGVSEFDLSGTGDAFTAAARLDGEIRPALLWEGSLGFTFVAQQFGDTTTFVVSEAQVQLQWPARLAPYIGVGAGLALDFRDEEDGGTQTDPTFSGAVGARFDLTEALGLRAELRLRGVGDSFQGSTAELTAGVGWRF
jgi:hypothetical protein